MRAQKTMILSLMGLAGLGLAGGLFMYRKLKCSATCAEKTLRNAIFASSNKKQAADALVDAMSEQSFPASDAPAY